MSTNLLTKNLSAAISGGFASVADMDAVGIDAVREAKSDDSVLQFRTIAKASKPVKNEERTRSYVFSDESVDRMGDVILQSGWDLSNYKENPVILWGHNSYAPPIGTASKVRTARVDGKKALVGNITFATEDVNPEADLIYRMVEAGIVKTGSVGFRPQELRYGEDVTAKERTKYGLSPNGMIYVKQDLLEHSLVSIPANPRAVELGLKDMVGKGIISEQRAASFLEVHPVTEEAALERARASVHSFIDMAKNLTPEQAASPTTPERGAEPLSPAPEDVPLAPPEKEGETGDAAPSLSDAPPVVVELEADASLIAHTEALTKLTLSLAGLMEAQAEQVHAVRQLTDQVHDLAQRGVSDSIVPTAPVEPVDTDDAGVDDTTELDVSRVLATLDNLSRSISGKI